MQEEIAAMKLSGRITIAPVFPEIQDFNFLLKNKFET
jgi:hypothetical protein